MPTTTGHFEKHLRSAREKYGPDILSIIVIAFGVTALLFLLSPR